MKALEFAKKLRKLAKYDFSRQEEPLKRAVELVRESVDENFDRQEDSKGAAWPVHSDLTILRHGPHPLLILTGKMRAAAAGGAGSYQKRFQAPKKMTYHIGINSRSIPYFGKHQFGTRKIPRRQFFYLHRSDRVALVAEVKRKIRAKVRKDNRWQA
ncbi:hypothetical protein VN12_26360 [Pirellula sp. SH-Sr6A]|uniref:hypothetical protein n=1 Tax=Pirellula sp. SH-Sr6A TaxID=1632865 RepID=UPI00078C9674|nr:hypothetical protein [Pirellula sp. SH-Sr6A]AMV35643.1 hypothetical protein VN12_26360 [Pirellula sp. SH-Sr6A]